MRSPPIGPQGGSSVGGAPEQPPPSQVPGNVSRLVAAFNSKGSAPAAPSGPPPPVSLGSASINWQRVQSRYGGVVQRGAPAPATPAPAAPASPAPLPLDLSRATTAAPLESKATAESLPPRPALSENVAEVVPPPAQRSVSVPSGPAVPGPSPQAVPRPRQEPQSSLDLGSGPPVRRGDRAPKEGITPSLERQAKPSPELIVVPEWTGPDGVELYRHLQQLAAREAAAKTLQKTNPEAAAKAFSEIAYDYQRELNPGSASASVAVASVKVAILRRLANVQAQALALQNAMTDRLPPGELAVEARRRRAGMALDYLRTLERIVGESFKPADREVLTATRTLFHPYFTQAAADAVDARTMSSVFSWSREAAKTAPDAELARAFHRQAADAGKAEAEALARSGGTYQFYLLESQNEYRQACADPLLGEALAVTAEQGIVDGMADIKQAAVMQKKMTDALIELKKRVPTGPAAQTIDSALALSFKKEKELQLRIANAAKSIRGKEGKKQVAEAMAEAAGAAMGYANALVGTAAETRLAWREAKTLSKDAASLAANSSEEKALLLQDASEAAEEEAKLSPAGGALSREVTALQLEAARTWRQVARDLHDKKGATREDLLRAADARTDAARLFEKGGKKAEALDCYQKSARNLLQSILQDTRTDGLNDLLAQFRNRELLRTIEKFEPAQRELLFQNLGSLPQMDRYARLDFLYGLGADMTGGREVENRWMGFLDVMTQLPPADLQGLRRLNQERLRQRPPPQPLTPMSLGDAESLARAMQMMGQADRLEPSAATKETIGAARAFYYAAEIAT